MRYISTFFLLFLCVSYIHCQKLTDTMFYNGKWEICEKPIAEYYRIGTLAIDSFWFFTGEIKDYTTENVLVMNGHYSVDGYKNGSFEFFYPNGNPMLKGTYKNDKMAGIWDCYYENGNHKATIYLPEDNNAFSIYKYTDETGKVLVENGSGSFRWREYEIEKQLNRYYSYTLEGEFRDSLRNGTWNYYYDDETDMNTLVFKEQYDAGKLKKAKYYGYYTEKISAANVVFNFEPRKIATTEKITYDEFLRKRDSTGEKQENFIKYIINGESPVITLKEKEFSKAFIKIILTLERHSSKINYAGRDIDGEIEFKISDKGYPEDISIKGDISEKEKVFIRYIMDKFKGIEMPAIDNSVGIEGYHKFYFFTFDPRPFVPLSIRSYMPKEDFIFSTIPKPKFLEFAKDIKKVIRKIINRRY